MFKDTYLEPVINKSGIKIKTNMEEVSIFNTNQTKNIIQLASTTSNKNGKLNDDRRSFIECNIIDISRNASPFSKYPSLTKQVKSIGLARLTGLRLLSNSYKKRNFLEIIYHPTVEKYCGLVFKKEKNIRKYLMM